MNPRNTISTKGTPECSEIILKMLKTFESKAIESSITLVAGARGRYDPDSTSWW